jgi:23S rRNA pseudouridine1911/1915/1917 synthase
MKHPIFGDVKYKGATIKGAHLALWAHQLKFVHPVTKQVLNFVSFPECESIPWKYFNLEKHINIKPN